MEEAEKNIPDEKIIIELDVDPAEFRRVKAEYYRTISCNSFLHLYEKRMQEFDALLELHKNMHEENTILSEFVDYQKYTPSLRHVKEDLQREEENLDRIKKEIKSYELTRKLIKEDIDSFTVDQDRLENR
ncbi:hypothetical protein Ngar_c14470 [Candidatus Nitrososphaera gargensis Ga9.2]|uniref:Uncharacterized protein n=1 Tax=Nitrososphaera gargensis (strain Ga9.2) TaxID=1237085 RepID=K0IHK1_NITGG|nr:hypothetical protein [Candidatus Nitrososphaera gargensis]AFU58383.1 hypothetical protein Ngar_c14470 [Candidatus Nitrososphaera gargensis Ga9.2]